MNELTDSPEFSEVGLASRSARFLAYLVDTVVILVLWIPIWLSRDPFDAILNQTATRTDGVWSSIIFFVIFLFLHGYLLAARGQTIGKHFVGTRIVSVDTHDLIPFRKLITLRYLPFHFATIIPCAGSLILLIDALLIFRTDKRCLHDHLAGSIVVKVQSE